MRVTLPLAQSLSSICHYLTVIITPLFSLTKIPSSGFDDSCSSASLSRWCVSLPREKKGLWICGVCWHFRRNVSSPFLVMMNSVPSPGARVEFHHHFINQTSDEFTPHRNSTSRGIWASVCDCSQTPNQWRYFKCDLWKIHIDVGQKG